MDFLRDYTVLLPTPLHGPINLCTSVASRLTSAFSSLLSHVQQSPDLASIALLLIIFFLSLKILNLLYRTVMFWITLVFKVVLYGGLAALGLWVWSRGLEGVEEDIKNWSGYWNDEYQYWSDRQRMGVQGMYGGQRARYNTVAGGGRGRWVW